MNGYILADYDGTGVIVVQKNDAVSVYSSDDQAVNAFLRCGGSIIKFPYNFVAHAIDTPENKAVISKAVYVVGVGKGEDYGYIKRLNKTSIIMTEDIHDARKLRASEVKDYVEKVKLQVGNRYCVDFYMK